MRHYAGLDVSLEETAICIVDETGKMVRKLRSASEPDALIETLATTGLDLERIGLEAAGCAVGRYPACRPAAVRRRAPRPSRRAGRAC